MEIENDNLIARGDRFATMAMGLKPWVLEDQKSGGIV